MSQLGQKNRFKPGILRGFFENMKGDAKLIAAALKGKPIEVLREIDKENKQRMGAGFPETRANKSDIAPRVIRPGSQEEQRNAGNGIAHTVPKIRRDRRGPNSRGGRGPGGR